MGQFPAGGGLGVADDPEIGEGLELGDELLARQSVERRDLELRYFRDAEKREVDFVVVERGVPVIMVESKLSDAKIDRSLRYLKRRFPECPAWQVSATGSKDVQTPEGIRICPAVVLLRDFV